MSPKGAPPPWPVLHVAAPPSAIVSHWSWRDDAACRDATPEQADALLDAQHPEDVEPLVERWCDACPVAATCLEFSESLRGSGVWGGKLLSRGRLVTHRRAAGHG